jgi:cell division transport system ATP-binding protein
MSESSPIIHLGNAKIFQRENLVLNNVDFTVNAGEFVYLVGRTGSGKSSLMRTLYGDLPLVEGEGVAAGFDLRKLKRRQVPYLRRKIGIVFQDFQLLGDRNVNDNLTFVMRSTGWKDKKGMESKVQEVLEKVGLGNKGYKMPHELSGGEQQRVSIARALVNDPELVLADEPTGNLDPETTAEIVDLLYTISHGGRCVIMATHDYTHMKKVNARVVRCDDGKLLEVSAEPVGVGDSPQRHRAIEKTPRRADCVTFSRCCMHLYVDPLDRLLRHTCKAPGPSRLPAIRSAQADHVHPKTKSTTFRAFRTLQKRSSSTRVRASIAEPSAGTLMQACMLKRIASGSS